MMIDAHGTLVASGHRLEYETIAPRAADAPTLVFLHEGLGCVAMWRDFPRDVAHATGWGALVYSRWGYGKSDPITPPRPLRYMHDEAATLGDVLDAAGVRDAILVGHSDGASIAIIHAGSNVSPRVRAIVLEAPHVFCEDVSVASIRAAADAYRTTDLRARLAKYHGDNVDGAFWGWNRAWLDPGFRAWNIEEYVPRVRVPALVVQGEDDRYGTIAQVDAIARGAGASVERAIFAKCGHSPHRDEPDMTRDAIASFVARVWRLAAPDPSE